jgi:hypothetical protein
MIEFGKSDTNKKPSIEEFANEIGDCIYKNVSWTNYDQDEGYVTEEQQNDLAYDARESAIASNRAIEKSIEELEMFVNANGSVDVEAYFDWFYSSNGRYMMDSNTLNPQTDKLHRFLIQPTAHKLSYTVGSDGSIKFSKGKKKGATELVNYALAQSMGFKVDKDHHSKIQRAGQALRSAKAEDVNNVLFGEGHSKEFKITADGKVISPKDADYKTTEGI